MLFTSIYYYTRLSWNIWKQITWSHFCGFFALALKRLKTQNCHVCLYLHCGLLLLLFFHLLPKPRVYFHVFLIEVWLVLFSTSYAVTGIRTHISSVAPFYVRDPFSKSSHLYYLIHSQMVQLGFYFLSAIFFLPPYAAVRVPTNVSQYRSWGTINLFRQCFMFKPLFIESILFPIVVTSNELNWQVFESKIKVVAEISLGPFLELSYLIRLQSSAFFAIVESLGGKLWLQTVVFVTPPPKKICHCQKKTFLQRKSQNQKTEMSKANQNF